VLKAYHQKQLPKSPAANSPTNKYGCSGRFNSICKNYLNTGSEKIALPNPIAEAANISGKTKQILPIKCLQNI
jgi:hypothetical protein